jgi:hypothetical protein
MNKNVNRVAQALGASRVVPLGRVDHTPLGLASLTERVKRLQSTGPNGTGRPCDPTCTVPRLVKFKPIIWRQLLEVAKAHASLTGRRVSPAQVASILIEQTLRSSRHGKRRAVHA